MDRGMLLQIMVCSSFRIIVSSDHHYLTRGGLDIGLYFDKIMEWRNYFLIVPWGDRLGYKLIVYDRVKRTVTNIDEKKTVINLAKDAEGKIWAATYEGPMLLDSVALENGEINFLNPSERLGNIVGNKHLFIYFDSENNAWLYGKDILKVSPQFREQHISAEQGLQSATLTDLFIDKEGTPWIATDGNGIIKIPNTNTEVLNKLDQRPIAISAIANQNDTIWFFNVAGQQRLSLFR